VTSPEPRQADRRRVTRQAWIDIAVLSALSILGILGFETSFGGPGFLVAAAGGLVVGVAVAVLGYQFGVGIPPTALAGVVAYFLLGTPIAVPSQGIAFVLPTLNSLSSLATGAAYGWKDILTLTTPIGAPIYISAVPYVAAWAVGLIFATLSVRWLPRHPRSSWRYAVALAGPIALYVVGVLVGTDEPVLAGVRGISFAIITLVWLGWRRSANQSASTSANRALVRRKLIGTVIVIAVAAVIAGGIGAVVPPSSYARFVLRDKITPPFDPLQYASPLSEFRYYTKAAATTKLFTVTGLKPGDRIRLATMDSYTGQLWNVVGTDVSVDGSGSFDLVGSTLPTSSSPVASTERTVHVSVDGYRGVWIPLVGYPKTLSVGGSAVGEDVHYNSATGTAALTGAEGEVSKGAQFSLTAEVPTIPDAAKLDKVAAAQVTLPAVYPVDVMVTQAQKHEGSGSSYEKLTALAKYLQGGYLSHGTTLSPSPSGHGANRMVAMFPPNGTLVGDAEQYASAFALEARALGFPARVVMGFKPKVSAGAASVTVVGSNVTAWDEVDFAGVGWVPFYPTPTKTGKPPKTPPPPVSQTVTQSRQPNRVGQPQNNILSPVAIKKQKPKPTPFALPGWVYLTAGVVAVPVVLYFVPLLLIAWFKRRRSRRRRTVGRGDERVAGAWDELTDTLAELGYRVPRGFTRRNTARAIQGQIPPIDGAAGPQLVELAAATDRAVFAGQDVPDDSVGAAWATARDEVTRARKSVPRWRRWLARFRVRSKRGLPAALTSIDTTAVTDRVKELVNR
jgi:Transglutaminase-like superfamily